MEESPPILHCRLEREFTHAMGMFKVTSDPEIVKGSGFYRLFLRAFPGHSKFHSIYLWQPFYTPKKDDGAGRRARLLRGDC